MKDNSKLIGVYEACEYLNIGRAKMRKLMRSGMVKYINVAEGRGACYRFSITDLDAFIELRKIEADMGVKFGSIKELGRHLK